MKELGLEQLAQMSNRYGADSEYVLAGGGNTSWKDETRLYIKPSGVSLKEIRPEDFVPMDRARLNEMLTAQYPADDKEREALALEKMMAAVAGRAHAAPVWKRHCTISSPTGSCYIFIRRWSMV